MVLFGLKASRKVGGQARRGDLSNLPAANSSFRHGQLFGDLLDVMLRVPMSFYDTTPIGRIVNRFSKGK